jgi:hypothetical protein
MLHGIRSVSAPAADRQYYFSGDTMVRKAVSRGFWPILPPDAYKYPRSCKICQMLGPHVTSNLMSAQSVNVTASQYSCPSGAIVRKAIERCF